MYKKNQPMLSVLLVVCVACTATKPEMLLSGMNVHESYLIDDDVISVIEYKEFVYFQEEEDKSQWLPISNEALEYFEKVENLHQPVRGISVNQALAYCDWRSKVWNEKNLGYTFEYRLPTRRELSESPLTLNEELLTGELIYVENAKEIFYYKLFTHEYSGS